MTKVVITEQGNTQAIVSGSTIPITVSGASFTVSASKLLNTVVVQQPPGLSIGISETTHSVVVNKPEGQILEVVTAGPQGPPFAGAQYFNTAAIGALTSGDSGTILSWDGELFSPTNELSENLTLAGGAF